MRASVMGVLDLEGASYMQWRRLSGQSYPVHKCVLLVFYSPSIQHPAWLPAQSWFSCYTRSYLVPPTSFVSSLNCYPPCLPSSNQLDGSDVFPKSTKLLPTSEFICFIVVICLDTTKLPQPLSHLALFLPLKFLLKVSWPINLNIILQLSFFILFYFLHTHLLPFTCLFRYI